MRLAEVMPFPLEPEQAIQLDALASRFIAAAAYCQTADEHLR